MDLNTLWFVLIAILFTGYFFLEGFDYGVGLLLPFLGRNDLERRQIIASIGPFWDGNEVWLIVTGGAMFAAFPEWYASMFSAFYTPLLFILVGLIVRNIGFEFRNKETNHTWRRFWDAMIFTGSLLPSFLWGVAIANIMQGVLIDQQGNYVGTLLNLLSPHALLGGCAFVAIFALHGALFLRLRLSGELMERAHDAARRLWIPTVVIMYAFIIVGYVTHNVFDRLGVNPGLIPLTAAASVLSIGAFIHARLDGWAFTMTGLTIIFSATSVFIGLYPYVFPSSLNPAYSLTIYNAASSTYTLTLMTWVALVLLPFVFGYQIWNYWIFRQRITPLSLADLH